MRLFLAVDFSPAVKQALCDARDRLADAATAGRFTHRDNFHITLAFLGEVPPSRVSAIRSCMNSIDCAPFSVTLQELGRFRRQGGDIWWMGLADCPELSALAGQLSDALRQRGFVLEDRRFSPHVTLGRQVILPREFRAFTPEPVKQQVTEFSLMQSERVGGRMVYTPLLKKILK